MAKLNQNQVYPATDQNDFFDLDKANIWNVIKNLFTSNGLSKTPVLLRVNGINGVIEETVNSISVTNLGITNGRFMGEVLKPNEIVNFDAGGINNFFPAFSLSYDTVIGGASTEFLITYIK